MSKELIKVTEIEGVEIGLLPSAIETRDRLLKEAASISSVSDSFEADIAADTLKSITLSTRQIEQARKAVKAPVLELGKKIDACAKEFSERLKEEESRIGRLLGNYEAIERKKKQEAERKAREEEARKRAEAEARIRAGEDAQKVEEEVTKEIIETKVEVSTASYRPEGTSVRETWQFEVTDINALFAAHPDLVVLSPNNTAIRAIIKHKQDIPGIRCWKEAKSYIR